MLATLPAQCEAAIGSRPPSLRWWTLLLSAITLSACEPYFGIDAQQVPLRCERLTCAQQDKNCGLMADGCGGFLQCGRCFEFETCGGGGDANQCGCTPICNDRCGGPDACGGLCPDNCEGTEVCGGAGFPNVCGCAPNCTDKCGGDDNCGGTCPDTCLPPNSCGGGDEENVCGCTIDCVGRCGGFDGCGGICPYGCTELETCGGGGEPNVCACPQECVGKCGGDDACGGQCPDTCIAPFSCGGAGEENLCGCTPTDCATILADLQGAAICGVFDNGCGELLACGSACVGQNVCNELVGECCVPDCTARSCGPDGCGGLCGSCPPGGSCGLSAPYSCSVSTTLCSDSGWCGFFPMPQGNALNDVHMSDADNAVMVGHAGTVLRWNSLLGFSRDDTSALTNQDLNAVFSLSPNEVVAVGNRGAVLRFADGLWSGGTESLASLYDVWALDAENIWAVGQGGTVIYYNGTEWIPEDTPITSDLRALIGFSAIDIWAVGSGGRVLHRGAHGWKNLTPTPALGTQNLYGVWGASPADVWVVGGGDADLAATNVIWHKQGVRWSKVEAGAYNDFILDTGLNSITGSDEANIWATGIFGEILHWDGISWRPAYEVWGSWASVSLEPGGTRGWAVGEAGNMQRLDLDAWTEVVPSAPSFNHDIINIHALNDSSIWALESSGYVVHFDGAAWRRIELPLFSDLLPRSAFALYALSDTDVWIVFSSVMSDAVLGAIMHFDGTNFTSIRQEQTDPGFHAVWASAADDVWVVGASGSMLRGNKTDGFVEVDAGTTQNFNDIDGTAANSIFAVTNGSLRHWDGTQWLQIFTTFYPLTAVSVGSSTNVWAVGTGGSVHYDGTNARARATPEIPGISQWLDVTATSTGEVLAVGFQRNNGQRPLIMRWDKDTWKIEQNTCSNILWTVDHTDTRVVAGGHCGVISKAR